MAARGKYSYNRSYYENIARSSSFNGNAALKLDVVPEEDYEAEEEFDELPEEFFEEDYAEEVYEEAYVEAPAEPERRRRTRRDIEREERTETRTRYRVSIDLTQVMIFAVAVTMLVFTAFKFIGVKSDISQTEKKIKAAQTKLADVNSLNASLASALDTEMDRNYIYSVAVGKLGMVYPNENQIVTYSPADTGYVRQMSYIPGN